MINLRIFCGQIFGQKNMWSMKVLVSLRPFQSYMGDIYKVTEETPRIEPNRDNNFIGTLQSFVSLFIGCTFPSFLL